MPLICYLFYLNLTKLNIVGERLKVLFTIPNFDTAGSGRVVHDLIIGLDKTKFEPEVCCFHDRGAYFKTIEQLGIPIHIFQFTTSYRPQLTFLFRVLKIRAFFKKHRFNIIHSWHWSSDISEPLAAKLAGIPFIYTKKAMGWTSRFWKWRSVLSTRIVTINDDMVSEYFSTMQQKIERISLGVDTNMFNPSLDFEIKRNDLQMDSTDFVIITVANLVAVKGIEILIQAVNAIQQDHIKLLIVGDHGASYGTWLKDTYETESIKFIGKQMDVRPYLALADVFVIPTKNEGRREGLPIALLEAMAMGKIAIGSNISGIKDILQPFPEQLFEAGSVENLESKLMRILALNNHEKLQLSKQTSKYIQDHFNVVDFIVKHEALYFRLLK